MAKRNDRKVHYGVPGTGGDQGVLVPWCETGYQAFSKRFHVAVNPMPAQVTCEHCRRGLALDHGSRP